MTAILSVRVRHQVQFAPNPQNTAFPTPAAFVETRLVRDVLTFPENVHYISFHDVVETVVLLPDGQRQTLYSPAVNEEIFHVAWKEDELDFEQARKRVDGFLVEVHPDLQERLLVFASVRANLKLQQVA